MTFEKRFKTNQVQSAAASKRLSLHSGLEVRKVGMSLDDIVLFSNVSSLAHPLFTLQQPSKRCALALFCPSAASTIALDFKVGMRMTNFIILVVNVMDFKAPLEKTTNYTTIKYVNSGAF